MARPNLPFPPTGYNEGYFRSLLQILNRYFMELDNPGPVECTSLNISMIPTSGYNLRVGEVYSDVGTLKIVLPDLIYVASFGMTASVGTVTVTT